MELSEFDNQYVRIIDADGEVFEGVCSFCSAEYCEAEIGPDEDALEIDRWMFFRAQIRSVTRIRPRDVFVWQSRTAYSATVGAALFDALDRSEGVRDVPVRALLPRDVRAGDVIRFENEADETDVLHALVEDVRRDPRTGEIESVAVRTL